MFTSRNPNKNNLPINLESIEYTDLLESEAAGTPSSGKVLRYSSYEKPFAIGFSNDTGETDNNGTVQVSRNNINFSEGVTIIRDDEVRIGAYNDPLLTGNEYINVLFNSDATRFQRDIRMTQGSRILSLTDPTDNQEAATKKYVDDNSGGGTTSSLWQVTTDILQPIDSTHNVSVAGNNLINVATPTAGTHGANKDYVDSHTVDSLITTNASLFVDQKIVGGATYNTLNAGSGNSSRLAFANGGVVKFSCGQTGLTFNGNGDGGQSEPDTYFYFDISTDTLPNIRVRKEETLFGKPINGQLGIGRDVLPVTDTSLVTDTDGYVYNNSPEFGIFNSTLASNATLYLGSNGDWASGGLAGCKNAFIFEDLNSWWRGHLHICNNVRSQETEYGSNVTIGTDSRIRVRGNDRITDIYDDLHLQGNDITNIGNLTATTINAGEITGANSITINAGDQDSLRIVEDASRVYLQTPPGHSLQLGADNSDTNATMRFLNQEIDVYGDIDFNNYSVTGIPTPTTTSSDSAAANKGYVNTQIENYNTGGSRDVWFRIENIAYNQLSAGALIPKADIKTNWNNAWFNNTSYDFQVLNTTDPILTFNIDQGYQIDAITGDVVDRSSETGVPKLLSLKIATEDTAFVRAYDLETANSVEFSFCLRVTISEVPT